MKFRIYFSILLITIMLILVFLSLLVERKYFFINFSEPDFISLLIKGKNSNHKDKHGPSPKLCVDAIIWNTNNPNEVLMIIRKNYPQGLALPGGVIKLGETVEHALIREINEETNLTISNFSLFGVYSDPFRDPRGHAVSLVYNANVFNINSLNPGEEARDADWYNVDNLIKNKEWIAFDHFQIISDYIKTRNK